MDCDVATLNEVMQSGDPDQAAQTLNACTSVLTDPTLWYWAIGFTILCAVVGALIGKYKNAVMRDTLLGLALGPIGWVISLILPAKKPPILCRVCKRPVDASDQHCRHCGALLKSAS